MSLEADVHDCFRRHNNLLRAADNARVAVDMLCVALRDDRPTPYPPREKVLARLKRIAEILNEVAPRSPLRKTPTAGTLPEQSGKDLPNTGNSFPGPKRSVTNMGFIVSAHAGCGKEVGK